MREIILGKSTTVFYDDLVNHRAIFVKDGVKLIGMIAWNEGKWSIFCGGDRYLFDKGVASRRGYMKNFPVDYSFCIEAGDGTMKQIILDDLQKDTINFADVDQSKPVFAKKMGSLRGMIVTDENKLCWALNIGRGSMGYRSHGSLQESIEYGIGLGYTFHVNKKEN